MRFEVKLPQRIGQGVLRRAGLNTKAYLRWWAGKEKVYPIEVSCPYIFSEEPVNIRLTVFVDHYPLLHIAIEVNNEILGKEIEKQIIRYSIENNGEAVAEQESKLREAEIEKILNKHGVTKDMLWKKGVVFSRPLLESLMRFCDEIERSRRLGICQIIMQHTDKPDRTFVARWLMKFLKSEKDPSEWSQISINIDNFNFAVPEIADDLIQLIKDRRHGGFGRGSLCMALVKTKDSRATEVIVSVLDEEGVTRWALECLGKLKASEYVNAARKFLHHQSADIRREAKKTLKKFGFPVETPPPPVHLTKNRRSLPKGLEEWSANFDIEDLKPTLEKLAQCIEDGFGAKEIAEVTGVTDEMKHNQTKSFCFPIITKSRENELWLIIFMDDIDSPDLAIHANSEVIEKFSSLVIL